MTRSGLAPSGIALLLMMAVFANSPTVRAASDSATTKTAAQEFKNIQVLKDIPADQLIPTMQFIGASLSVECDFCHAGRDKDKDDKDAKKKAREMMRMTFAINQNNFSGKREVTCNTCHQGSIHPQAVPVIMADGDKSVGADHNQDRDDVESASWPSGTSVVAKYLEALGGKAALDKVATRIEKGKAELAGGRNLPIEVFEKSPDELVSVMRTPNGDSVTGYNGNAGWLATPGRPSRDMSPAEEYAAKLDATVLLPEHLISMFAEIKLQPHSEVVEGHAATVVWGLNKGMPPVKFYFDPQTGLLLRMRHYVDTALGLNPTQVDYSDYRDVGGVKTPFCRTIARPGGAFTIQLDYVSNNAPIDAAVFVEPEPSSEAGTEGRSAH